MTDETADEPEGSVLVLVLSLGMAVAVLVAVVGGGYWFVTNAAMFSGPSTTCADVPVETATDAETVLLYEAEPDGFFDDNPGSGYLATFPNGTYTATGPLQSFDGEVAQHYTDLLLATNNSSYLLVDQNEGMGVILQGPANRSTDTYQYFDERTEYDIYERCEVQVA
ncbi:hypothetical protein NDI85_19965 [Halomicroarcula sp. S1AR25-4]|uniref:hypothetical protein n=1 Tax=Haloarcula sp. S1AR25-4 TaxID=2950538 RepID=UPI002874900C|nr:hypothetical protein [Halomicroarcula sp. S1AR25-4]MDS0280065.1 hypothetical protein [Halomicroarcula sp. S1AR25-4]